MSWGDGIVRYPLGLLEHWMQTSNLHLTHASHLKSCNSHISRISHHSPHSSRLTLHTFTPKTSQITLHTSLLKPSNSPARLAWKVPHHWNVMFYHLESRPICSCAIILGKMRGVAVTLLDHYFSIRKNLLQKAACSNDSRSRLKIFCRKVLKRVLLSGASSGAGLLKILGLALLCHWHSGVADVRGDFFWQTEHRSVLRQGFSYDTNNEMHDRCLLKQ